MQFPVLQHWLPQAVEPAGQQRLPTQVPLQHWPLQMI
jgi:hypothetical protein